MFLKVLIGILLTATALCAVLGSLLLTIMLIKDIKEIIKENK